MKNSIRLSTLVLLLLVFVACKKSSSDPPAPAKDTTGPTIVVVDPTPGKSYVLGSPLHLQMDLGDNVELKSYKVTIVKSLKGIQTTDWGLAQTWTIAAGKKTFAVNHNEITVPTTVAGNPTTTGNYEFTVTCWDTSDNPTTSTAIIIALTK